MMKSSWITGVDGCHCRKASLWSQWMTKSRLLVNSYLWVWQFLPVFFKIRSSICLKPTIKKLLSKRSQYISYKQLHTVFAMLVRWHALRRNHSLRSRYSDIKIQWRVISLCKQFLKIPLTSLRGEYWFHIWYVTFV